MQDLSTRLPPSQLRSQQRTFLQRLQAIFCFGIAQYGAQTALTFRFNQRKCFSHWRALLAVALSICAASCARAADRGCLNWLFKKPPSTTEIANSSIPEGSHVLHVVFTGEVQWAEALVGGAIPLSVDAISIIDRKRERIRLHFDTSLPKAYISTGGDGCIAPVMSDPKLHGGKAWYVIGKTIKNELIVACRQL
jgi:hypothetical protein